LERKTSSPECYTSLEIAFLYTSTPKSTVLYFRDRTWTGLTALMEEEKNINRILMGKPYGKR
jgi:hypothetical protein